MAKPRFAMTDVRRIVRRECTVRQPSMAFFDCADLAPKKPPAEAGGLRVA